LQALIPEDEQESVSVSRVGKSLSKRVLRVVFFLAVGRHAWMVRDDGVFGARMDSVDIALEAGQGSVWISAHRCRKGRGGCCRYHVRHEGVVPPWRDVQRSRV